MKKLVLTATLLVAVVSAYSQGTVNWANGGTTLVSTNSYSGLGTAPVGSPAGVTSPLPPGGQPPQYIYGLFVASPTTSVGGILNTEWRFTGNYATNTTAVSGGRLNGGTASLANFDPTLTAGTRVSLMVRGWDGSFGKDWSAVQTWYNADANGVANVAKTGWYGESAVAVNAQIGGGAIGTFALFGTSATTVPGFTLKQINPVPEPTTFALAGLAGAALLIFRRRK